MVLATGNNIPGLIALVTVLAGNGHVWPLDPGVRADVGVDDEVVDDASPRVVLRQMVVILGRNLLNLNKSRHSTISRDYSLSYYTQ